MRKKRLISALFLSCCAIAIAGCTTNTGKDNNDDKTNQVEEYTVTFNSKGGSAVSSQTVKTGEKVKTPAVPSREGYVFRGWYTDEACTSEWKFDVNTVTANTTLYAKWEVASHEESYSITYVSEYGIVPEKVNEATTLPDPLPTLEESGWEFKGWYTTIHPFEESSKAIAGATLIGDVILYAKWEEKSVVEKFTITFDSNGGSTVDSVEVEKGNKLTSTTPTKENYTFEGWYKTNPETDSNAVAWNFETDTVTEDTTLYAKWKKVQGDTPTPVITYSITYISDHGTKPADVAKATTLPNPLPVLSETGWEFKGWYTTNTYTESSKAVAGATLAADATLYAKWEKVSTPPTPVVTYSITYISDHGTKPADVSEATTLPNPLPVLSETGWEFKGWYTTNTYTESNKAVAGATLAANTTLYARWEKVSTPPTPVVTYSITYVSDYGTKPADVSKATTLPNPLPEMKYTGWTFEGWYTTNNYATGTEAVPGKTLDKNVILYAKWVQNKYSVSFNLNGKGDPIATIQETPTLPNPLPKPTDDTQIFAGWYLEKELKNKATPGMLITEDVTLYAKWVEQSTFVLDLAEGYLESAYAEWQPFADCVDYHVYYKKVDEADSAYKKIDQQLIREYPSKYRADIIGLKAGNYTIKVLPVLDNQEVGEGAIENVVVKAHDRSGFAFSQKSTMKTASGAYNDDGTLKSNAKVIYVSASNAKTVTCEINGTTHTGLQTIIDAQKEGTTPLCVRLLGLIELKDLDDYLSKEEGIQVKGKNGYSPMNLTIEGIGEDATCKGFGFLIRNCANVELRNFAVMNHLDDAISIDTKNCNLWVHNLDLYYGGPGGDSDQAKGDGFVDIKKSQYCTVSYNHFYDSGKCCLIDASEASSDGSDYLTYHHNWFDHSDSRHPRVRNGKNIHIYNNYYDGVAKYGVGATTGSSSFVEANYFRNVKHPMMIAGQGSDVDPSNAKGTFSGETGGMIKAFNNKIVGGTFVSQNDNATDFDAVVVANRNDKVTAYSCKKGGGTYSNFDTDSSIMYSYTPDDPNDVEGIVTQLAGRINGGDFHWNFNDSVDDADYSVNAPLKQAIVNYKSTLVRVLGIEGTLNSGGGDNTGGTTGGDQPGTGEDNPPAITGEIAHNFTTDGKTSSVFTINGNLSTSKGTVTYKNLTLTQCLKMESSTSISFNTNDSMILVLVFHEPAATIKVDGTEYSATNGIVQVTINSGSHTITKADSGNLFYIELGKAQ